MAGMTDYYGRMAGALQALDQVLPERPEGAVSISALSGAFSKIKQIVEIGERGVVHDEVLDRLSHSDLGDGSLIDTVLTMSRELPLSEQEPA